MNFYHKVFYHIYKSFSKNDKEADAVLTSFLVLAFIQAANVFTIALILDILGINLLTNFFKLDSDAIYIGGFYLVIAGLNYLYFTSDDRYKPLIKEISKKSVEERKKGARITLAYGLVSILLIFILAPLRVM